MAVLAIELLIRVEDTSVQTVIYPFKQLIHI